MGWKLRLRKSKPFSKSLSDVLKKLDHHALILDSKQDPIIATLKKRQHRPNQKTQEEQLRKEAEIDSATLDMLIAIIRDTLHDEDDVNDRRWTKRLQWPSQKYLRSSFVRVQEQLLPTSSLNNNGEVKIMSANAGDIACLGPCLMQTQQPIHTLIVHGEMEYCTLLGHLLHIDVGVYFAALRTFAHFLRGNRHLRELVFAFTTCPQSMTDKHQQPVSKDFAQEVLPSFEQVLEGSEGLRHISFRVTHEQTQRVPLGRMLSTSYEATCRLRTAVLCATHPRSVDADPIVRDLPHDILRKVLDMAFPLPAGKTPAGRSAVNYVDFEFSHVTSFQNKSKFVLWRSGHREGSLSNT